MTAVQYAIADTLVLAKRSLKRIPRQPDLLVGFTIQPIMFVLLFVYVFGGAIDTEPLDYVDFLIPGIIVQSMVFGGFVTALGLSEDLKKGLIDRFRSLPMWGPAVIAGRILADVGTNVIQLVIMFTVGIIVGFRFATSFPEIVAGMALLLLIGYAFSWVFAFMGLSASSPEAANAYGFTILFPLTFISSAFVPVDTMPDWLQPIAEHNPFTTMVNAARALFVGDPGRQRHLARGGLVVRDHRRLQRAVGVALSPRSRPLTPGRRSRHELAQLGSRLRNRREVLVARRRETPVNSVSSRVLSTGSRSASNRSRIHSSVATSPSTRAVVLSLAGRRAAAGARRLNRPRSTSANEVAYWSSQVECRLLDVQGCLAHLCPSPLRDYARQRLQRLPRRADQPDRNITGAPYVAQASFDPAHLCASPGCRGRVDAVRAGRDRSRAPRARRREASPSVPARASASTSPPLPVKNSP